MTDLEPDKQIDDDKQENQQKGIWASLTDGLSNAYNTITQGASAAYDRAKTIGQGGIQIGSGIGDAVGAVGKLGGGLSKIYKGVTGSEVPNYVKYGAAGLAGLTALNNVPGIGLVTSGLTKLGGGLAKATLGSAFGTMKKGFGAVSNGVRQLKNIGSGLKSTAQTLHRKGKQNGRRLYDEISRRGNQIYEGAAQTYNVGKQNFLDARKRFGDYFPYDEDVHIQTPQGDQLQVIQEGEYERIPFRKGKTKGIRKVRQRKVVFTPLHQQQPSDFRKIAMTQ